LGTRVPEHTLADRSQWHARNNAIFVGIHCQRKSGDILAQGQL
jgi:hypothetical protein